MILEKSTRFTQGAGRKHNATLGMAQKTKVYVADNHPVFRRGLKQVIENDPALELAGEAGDDVTALADIKRTKPTVVILEVRLPRQGGLELVKALRGVRPSPACLMLTTHAEEATFNAAMDAGARGYVLKDDALELLLLGVKAVAVGSLYVSPTISGRLWPRRPEVSALKQQKLGLSALTPAERRIIRLITENKTNKKIANELCISPRTVETHRSNICRKLELQGAHKLLPFAIEHWSEL